MARMNFPGKKAFLGFVIMSQMFRAHRAVGGISQLLNLLGLNDTIMGLMLINAAFNQASPYGFTRDVRLISPEMEQAARIDGCSTAGRSRTCFCPWRPPARDHADLRFHQRWNEYTISTVSFPPRPKSRYRGITQFSSFKHDRSGSTCSLRRCWPPSRWSSCSCSSKSTWSRVVDLRRREGLER
jgi:ABC-type glycerol-3-phosphate transport system permease component